MSDHDILASRQLIADALAATLTALPHQASRAAITAASAKTGPS
jgi:hypothetical protein